MQSRSYVAACRIATYIAPRNNPPRLELAIEDGGAVRALLRFTSDNNSGRGRDRVRGAVEHSCEVPPFSRPRLLN